MGEMDEITTPAEIERYERVRSRIGISVVSDDKRVRERNATAASMASISGRRKSRSARPGRLIWGRDA